MKIKTLYVRFYKSFNYDYLRKSHPKAVPDEWDRLPESGLFYPFVRVTMEPGITTVVGANESGKSQLLGAIKCLLTGEDIERRDFCRYSQFFTVGGEMKKPEFGGEFTDLSDEQVTAVRSIAGLGESVKIEMFHFFRMNTGAVVYVKNGTDWTEMKVKAAEIKSLGLPTFFLIDANTPLPDSVPLAYLTATDKAKKARPRKKMLRWIENMITNPDWFGSKETIDKATPQLIENYAAFNAVDEVDDEHLMKRLELAEKLLVQVAGIGKDAFEQLKTAVRNHDGYANGIVKKMNEDLAKALNFPKWWSQDSEFSLTLTLRDFDLVFTVRDRTGSEYAFSERSGGMSYFLSYFVQYLSHVPTGGQETLLMDEPDAYLSMLGQQDLLRIFDSFAWPEDKSVRQIQVVYVTHSPFLIDKNHSERIRVLEKGDGEEGTRLVANAGRNHYEPLRSAFGAFVAETTFISNCNLMLEGQADQVLLAGISSLARRSGSTGSTLNLNSLSLVPSGSAEHIPYMVYLARGRDVDTPAVVVLLDGDGEADGIREELKKGYRDKKYVDDEFVIQSSDIDVNDVTVATDAIREIEDLIPVDLVIMAIRHYAAEVLSPQEAAEVAAAVTAVPVAAGQKVFKAAEAACRAAGTKLRLDKVGFARAVLHCLEHEANQDLKALTTANFEQLFTRIDKAQRQAVRSNGRERVRKTLTRHKDAFLRDHQASALRRDVEGLLEDIEHQLTEVTDETERVRKDMRLIRRDFDLAAEPGSVVENYDDFKERLEALPYGGVQAVQAS
ncbi:AAA family ATPase [Rathayibacter sp. VKM Ac-2926]|uniref:AAA family ATPase n=1 Tax=Rathayibacter sp. VKM Ac-2926 TaxID=2929477 RepID=UPI001FB1D339|nr:AAA family ATPase [Rathayibacter sp. VKM Ac-2926]MCJ1703450.1 AAA family ATPase [Rathayibacter sp. VKM Ac-2926]